MQRRRFLATPLLLPTLTWPAEALLAYPPVTPGPRLAFPRDHGGHPDFRTEWWYVTGALDSPQPDVGFQLTFFRNRPGTAETLRSPLAARQILWARRADRPRRKTAAYRTRRPRQPRRQLLQRRL